MLRTQIQLQAEQVYWLKRHALENGISMSQAIRDCIDFYRSNTERLMESYLKKEKALNAVGAFASAGKKSD
jgi:hypothetical protein